MNKYNIYVNVTVNKQVMNHEHDFHSYINRNYHEIRSRRVVSYLQMHLQPSNMNIWYKGAFPTPLNLVHDRKFNCIYTCLHLSACNLYSLTKIVSGNGKT
ncbi:unnamed protein product [Spodoptera littoralis]|uniref:Uncharacterized protein n=1 Tax=Spodoptera littoralis TaxID=7109 RepID=A0A9P0II10_SPOLI|nr:unnamed protein product [Spodoptera littoralis]CAH1647106.1 unnamed protein product [Spodoptera littoralis]